MEAVSPLQLERYELKYLITLDMVESISKYVENYCVLDYFSEISHDKYYEINNLYLDSPNYLFLQRRLAGVDDRFNMRIRSYGVKPQFPYFLEVKSKKQGFVNKIRAKVSTDNWVEELKSAYVPDEGIGLNHDNKYSFYRLFHSYNAEPKVFTQYRRKAYLSTFDDYARVTFDKDLRYMRRDEFNLQPEEDQMCNYDFSQSFGDEENCIVLELKCENKVPLWMLDLITHFGLERQSFSKYITGVNECIPDFYTPKFDRISCFN